VCRSSVLLQSISCVSRLTCRARSSPLYVYIYYTLVYFKLRPWVSVVCRILLHQACIGKSCNSQNDDGLFKSSSTQQQKLWRGESSSSHPSIEFYWWSRQEYLIHAQIQQYRKHVDRRVYIVTTHFSCRFVIIFDCFNVSNKPQKIHTTTIRAAVDYRLTIHVLVYNRREFLRAWVYDGGVGD
jgi:hypothetical protein